MMTESKMPPKDACLAEATSEQSEQSVVSASVEELLQDGEIVLLVARPSPWFVLIDGGTDVATAAISAAELANGTRGIAADHEFDWLQPTALRPAAAVPARRHRRRALGGLRPIVTGAVKAAHCVAVSNAAARYVVRRGMVAAALATWSLHWRLQIRSGKRLRERSTY